MNVKITCGSGLVKLLYDGVVLKYLNDDDLESLRADIFMAQMERSIQKEMALEFIEQENEVQSE